jgi:hypothetical protein
VDVVQNVNTDTIIVNQPPTEFLPDRPPTEEAIHNVYELKTSPEPVRYLHMAAGFPTKPQWITAIKNKQYASWPGLSVDAVRRHFPESDETHKGHGRKTPSGLRSTKSKEYETLDGNDAFQFNSPEDAPLRPIKKALQQPTFSPSNLCSTVVKLMLNSIISTPNAKFMTIDIKDFYLMTPMDRFEYFQMKLELFPQDIIKEYGLRDKVDTDDNVFCEVR